MASKYLFKNQVMQALRDFLRCKPDDMCSKVIAIDRKTLVVRHFDNSDQVFKPYESVFDHPKYEVTYATALLEYNEQNNKYRIDKPKVDAFVELYFMPEPEPDIEEDYDEPFDDVYSDDEFSQSESDYWYFNNH